MTKSPRLSLEDLGSIEWFRLMFLLFLAESSVSSLLREPRTLMSPAVRDKIVSKARQVLGGKDKITTKQQNKQTVCVTYLTESAVLPYQVGTCCSPQCSPGRAAALKNALEWTEMGTAGQPGQREGS